MNEMRLVRELSAQITQMIPLFVQKHRCRPTVVFLPPPTIWLVDMVVMANAAVMAPELASIDLHPYFRPARPCNTPSNDTLH